MSQDKLEEFLSKLDSDESLRASLKEQYGNPSEGIGVSELVAFAEEQGYQFSVEEAPELQDGELEQVAGGLGFDFHKDWVKLGSLKFAKIRLIADPKASSYLYKVIL